MKRTITSTKTHEIGLNFNAEGEVMVEVTYSKGNENQTTVGVILSEFTRQARQIKEKKAIQEDLIKQYQQIEESIANITEIMAETETGRGLVQKTWGFEFHIDDLYRQANESKSRTEEE